MVESLRKPGYPVFVRAFPHFRCVPLRRLPGCGSVEFIRTGHHLQQEGGIRYILCEDADLVEGRSVGNEAVARDAAVSGLQSHDAAEVCGLSDRAAGIATQRSHAES